MNEEKAAFTYQTRLKVDEDTSRILDEYATLFGKVERSLFAKICSGANPLKLKSEYIIRFGITARQFNASRVQLLGKIDSYKKLQPLHIANLQDKIESLQKTLGKIKRKEVLHQKKRRLNTLKRRLEKRQKDLQNGTVRLCFGGKKQFRSQFDLEESGYRSHEEWKQAWEESRNSQFFVLGSKDETAGNQSCVATPAEDGQLNLRLRLPHALAGKHGKFLTIPNVTFKYGQDIINASLNASLERKLTKNKNSGQAISYRFKKDHKGWTLYVTTDFQKPKTITQNDHGAIGIDINANHLALVEIDRHGNPIAKKTISLNTYGKNKNQALALIGDACAEIITYAEQTKKPLIIEKLNFQKKKAALKEQGPKKYSRMLSSFSYSQIISMLKAKAFRHGVQIHQVDPAFTSIIGHVRFALRYGLTKHHAAALCIARRHFKFSEQPPQSSITIIDGKEGQLTLSLPARNRNKHVWSFWGLVGRKIQTALAAHFRAIRNRSSDPPIGSCDKKFPEVFGEIPKRESLAALLG